MSLINFESSRVKEQKRQWEREARNAILEKAKSKYESEISKEEARRQRGEHTWMLPSVESKLDSAKQERKKKKKDKKKKKKKAKKKKSSSSSSSESDEESESWVEKPTPSLSKDEPSTLSPGKQQVASQGTSKRDDWMEMTSLFKTYTRDEIKDLDGNSRKKEKEEERRRKQEADKPGSHARELNPYYKDGGTGLPEENTAVTSASVQSPSLGLDASWLRKALQRAKEQAKLENVTLEEIASRRWGSLEKFNELLAQAEGKGKDQDKWKNREMQHSYRKRSKSRERRRSQSRERKRSRSRDRKRSRSRDRRSNSRGKYRSVSKERNRSRSRDRKRNRSRDRKRSTSRERRRSRSSERQKYKSWKECKDRHRHSQIMSKEKSQEGIDREGKSRDKDERNERKYRRYSNSSDSSSDSTRSSSSNSDSGDRRKSSNAVKKEQYPIERNSRLMKAPNDEIATQRSSLLSSKFHRPGEDIGVRHGAGMISSGSSSSNRGWQKKDYIKEEQMKVQSKSKRSSSSASSSSESDSECSDKDSTLGEEAGKKVPVSSGSTLETLSEKPSFLTDKEMNELAAKVMKAELMGNDNLANKLKNKLEAARNARANDLQDSKSTAENPDGAEEQVVILTRTDARGFSRPVSLTDPSEKKKKQGKTVTHGKDGKRTKYFPDDDKYSLKQMFEAEKSTSAEDQNSLFNRAAMKNHEKLSEDYDMDDMFMSKAALKESSAKQEERDRKRAIQEHQRCERSLESCQWCFDNKEMAKHLIVALGTKAYVCLPPYESLTSGHCLIVPVHHVMSSVHADEDLWGEIMNFRKSLVKMFNSREEDCIFFETVKRLRNFPHMTLHCVPLPKEMGDMAPIYFKKAIMECEAEWAQNKKLVDLKNRNVRKAVPKGLPYFFVDFAMDAGYAHVIEDEQIFPSNFAQEIVGGMLDLETNLWRKPRKENFDAQRRKVMEFSRWYKDFDITQDEKD